MAKRIVITIEVEGDSFKPTETIETARILRVLANTIGMQRNFSSEDYFMLYDANGNTCGGAGIEE